VIRNPSTITEIHAAILSAYRLRQSLEVVALMTVRVLHAGDGYTNPIRQVESGIIDLCIGGH
jgi:hypothetical protein